MPMEEKKKEDKDMQSIEKELDNIQILADDLSQYAKENIATENSQTPNNAKKEKKK